MHLFLSLVIEPDKNKNQYTGKQINNLHITQQQQQQQQQQPKRKQ
jgi:hypothetical protein